MPDPATDPATDPDTRPVNPPGSLTLLLHRAHAGDPAAGDAAYRQLYPELLKIARARLRVHRAPTLLDTEALVHESFLRFVRSGHFQPDSRKHFYAYAAQAMRHIVIDFARRSAAERRGGALEQVTFDTGVVHQLPQPQPVLDVDRALASLQALDPLLAELVEMRFYGGYTEAEIAEALGISDRTVRRHWDKARAFLLMELQGP